MTYKNIALITSICLLFACTKNAFTAKNTHNNSRNKLLHGVSFKEQPVDDIHLGIEPE